VLGFGAFSDRGRKSVRRREFITVVGGAMVSPLVSHAQQSVPVIGFLSVLSPSAAALPLSGFRQGLSEGGYVENQNVTIEFRWAEGHYDTLPSLAHDLVDRRVAVIAAGGPPAARAAKAATSTIPIVFSSGDDPVRIGLVPSLNHPGGNITGVHLLIGSLNAKRLGLLRDLLPQVTVVGAIINPTSPSAQSQVSDLRSAGHALGLQIQIEHAINAQEIDAAFDHLAEQKVGALLLGSDASYSASRV
jgi:putative tryptophan/tyrosine transport system substrate-binding protein